METIRVYNTDLAEHVIPLEFNLELEMVDYKTWYGEEYKAKGIVALPANTEFWAWLEKADAQIINQQ